MTRALGGMQENRPSGQVCQHVTMGMWTPHQGLLSTLLLLCILSSHSEPQKPLVLVVGLPRSGSLALYNFFVCNGLKSSHYCCDGTANTAFPCANHRTCGECVHSNWNASRPAFAGCGGDAQVYAQFDVESHEPFEWFLPQHYALPLLHRDYPDAVWILNTRSSSNQWATSVLHWYSIANRLLNSFGLLYHKDIPETTIAPLEPLSNQKLYVALEEAVERANDAKEHERRLRELMEVYERHSQQVREFAQSHGRKLIEVTVDDPNAGSGLVAHFPGFKTDCWKFDADALDNDWKNLELPF